MTNNYDSWQSVPKSSYFMKTPYIAYYPFLKFCLVLPKWEKNIGKS